MEAPPNLLDYYRYISPNQTNPATTAASFSWHDLSHFWGTVANQYWSDMDAIQRSGTTG